MKQIYFFFLLLFFQLTFSQNEIVNDSIVEETKKWEFSIDLASRYIWRGQSWGGDYPVIQPTITFNVTDKLSIGTWATSNFKSDYFYDDGTEGKGYHEIDFFVSYAISDVFTFELWDYYWPTVSKVEGIDNGYFNYGLDGTKSVDVMLVADLTEVWQPFTFTLSSLIGGNDYRFDANGENPKRNFTTYFETSYTKSFYEKFEVVVASGLVFNNQAEYYTYGDYNKPSLVNLNVKTSYQLILSKKLMAPLWLSYTYNATDNNTEPFGRNFLVFGTTIMFP